MIAKIVKSFAVVTLGLIVPLVIIAQAYTSLGSLGDTLSKTANPAMAMDMFTSAQKAARNGNDYALFSQIYAETANQRVVTNKQVIKVAVMQIGFAAISLGLMFVILGINDGGGQGNLGILDVKLDFKTASTGALVFMVGAAMATAGGVLRNEYTTVGAPQYVYAGGPSQAEADSHNAYRTCKAQARPEAFGDCFATLYAQVNEGYLK